MSGAVARQGLALLRRLPWIALTPACRGCGDWLEPLAAATLGFPYVCNRCFDGLPWRPSPAPEEDAGPIDRVWAPWHYAAPVQQWIWQYKYQRRDGWARCFAGLAAQSLAAGMPLGRYTHITPVPLHRRRFHWRGFNQALLLAHHWRGEIGALKLPVAPLAADLLRRTRHTRPQMELDAEDRQGNVAGAFAVDDRHASQVEGAHVLLVDDVMTTGATLKECAAELKRAGAETVEALVIARA